MLDDFLTTILRAVLPTQVLFDIYLQVERT